MTVVSLDKRLLVVLGLLAWLITPDPCSADSPLLFEGFTEAHRNLMIGGAELGRVDEVLVKMGDRVRRGDVLARLDNESQRVAVELSRAQASMTGDLEIAIADEALQRDRVENLRDLAAKRMATPNEVRRAEGQHAMSVARIKQAREQIRLWKLQLRRDELALRRRELIAPVDGVIARVLHQAGEFLTPGDATMFQLLKVDIIDAVFNIPIADMTHIRQQQAVRVFLRSQGRSVEGMVARISPSIDGKSGTVQVRIEINNAQGLYFHGDRCTLRIDPGATPVESTAGQAGPQTERAGSPVKMILSRPILTDEDSRDAISPRWLSTRTAEDTP